jgi:DNA-binding response OmpR family regulator
MNPSGGPRVLLAEADEAIASSLAKVLEAAGYQVRVAGEGCAAARHLISGNPDLLFVDLDTFSDESSVFRQVLRETKTVCPIVLLSGSSTRSLREEAKLVGVLLDKPTDAGVLLTRISHLLQAGPGRESSGPRAAALLGQQLGRNAPVLSKLDSGFGNRCSALQKGRRANWTI